MGTRWEVIQYRENKCNGVIVMGVKKNIIARNNTLVCYFIANEARSGLLTLSVKVLLIFQQYLYMQY